MRIGVMLPWSILMALQVYRFGIKEQQMPPPYTLLWGSLAMGVCSIIAQANDKAGTLLAWGVLVAGFVAAYNTTPTSQTSQTTPVTSAGSKSAAAL